MLDHAENRMEEMRLHQSAMENESNKVREELEVVKREKDNYVEHTSEIINQLKNDRQAGSTLSPLFMRLDCGHTVLSCSMHC